MKEDFDTTLFLEHDDYLSFKDLEKIDDWRDVLVNEDKKRLEEILYTNGCDTNYGYVIKSCEHRMKTGPFTKHFGPMIQFKMRTDKYWLDNYAPVEDVARVHPSSFVRAGMVESLNGGVHLDDLIQEQLSTNARLLEMKKENKGKK